MKIDDLKDDPTRATMNKYWTDSNDMGDKKEYNSDIEVYKADEVDTEIQGYKDELAKYVIDMSKLEARIRELEKKNMGSQRSLDDTRDFPKSWGY